MPRIRLEFGREHTDVEVRDGALLTPQRGPATPAIADVPGAVRQALEAPLDFPPLRQALTPDDHVSIVITEQLAHLPELLGPVLEYVVNTGVDLQRITVICPPRPGNPAPEPWRQALPESLRVVPAEVHAPAARDKLSYLATTKAGRRVYLNRTLVDADQLVVIGGIGYDAVLGYHGGLGDVFPTLSDEPTRAEFALKASPTLPNAKHRPALQEVDEVGWLLGMPFVLQVIEGPGDDVSHVLAGAHSSVAAKGHELLDRHWRVTLQRSSALVVATLSGDPTRQTFADVTRAFAAAARAVQPGGRIVLLSKASGDLGPSGDFMRGAENLPAALAQSRLHKMPDAASVWELGSAAQFARLYLLSDWPRETVEELFMVPLDHAGQLQNLINTADSCCVLPDAHKTLALVQP